MEQHEEGDCSICCSMPSVSTSQDGASKTSWIFATFSHSRTEVGGHYYGLVMGLPRTLTGKDAIWVIMDRLTRSAHFLAIRVDFSLERLARLYINEIVRLHGAPTSVVSNRDRRFVSQFWESVHKAMGTNLKFSTTFHPQTDGLSERTIQTLEDILRACVIDFKGS